MWKCICRLSLCLTRSDIDLHTSKYHTQKNMGSLWQKKMPHKNTQCCLESMDWLMAYRFAVLIFKYHTLTGSLIFCHIFIDPLSQLSFICSWVCLDVCILCFKFYHLKLTKNKLWKKMEKERNQSLRIRSNIVLQDSSCSLVLTFHFITIQIDIDYCHGQWLPEGNKKCILEIKLL